MKLSAKMDITEVNHLLAQRYGRREWHPHRDPLSVLIGTILSQNTSDVNSKRAFASLTNTFKSWEAIAVAEPEKIEQAIRCGGLSRIKAVRIKAILQMILKMRGSLDLTFLAGLPLPEAKAWLRSLPGVGPKTAGCVLLFSLGRPVLPVDTHVYRIAKRLKLIGDKVSVEEAHEILERMLPPEDIYQFHLNMIEHGRQVCRARHPRCAECVLNKGCPSRQ